ncbi:zinc ABC transporter ATP-binding protein ZnuC [Pseudomaricurvus alkylphenolicus]|jgi:zinc transport system ATP-binding protein|uniref:zinc ABC transporter ATP-binding protein ZnuC n=1 Tax=Pseudomaricurvus alkylphenolicus TaxID=1306991 RepID=UPI001421E7FE|nr:zinc ABC transporter ATP-binding protein ZnuC [Pseudomaricurvus alkylphenolicus]NIB39532.1 zinc ABC transporter ATP-binding protein ZnuC [Pseudomaricurvus alkylphenolicus]
MSELLIKATDLCLEFGDRRVLDRVSIQMHRGEIVTLIGPNGAGKTSLVRIALGLQHPSSGELWRRTALKIGYMPQKLHIEPSLPLSVRRFLQLAQQDPTDIEESLQLTGISHLLNSPMARLSGGETQRVLLARALLRAPDLLVLDEPVQGVDVAGQAKLYQLITDIRNHKGCGVLMVSHDLHLVMAATDTVVCLNQHVCCHGHPESVSEDPAYLELFGQAAHSGVAVYTHHHDHDHDIHGEMEHRGSCENQQHA